MWYSDCQLPCLPGSFAVEVDSACVGVEFVWVGDGSSRFKDWGPASVWFLGGGGSPSVEELLDGMRVPACPGLVGLFFPEALLDLQCCTCPVGLVLGLVSWGVAFVEVEWRVSFEVVSLKHGCLEVECYGNRYVSLWCMLPLVGDALYEW